MNAQGSASARLFFALWPQPAEAARLAQLAELLVERHGGRASQQKNLHLTLAFLGDVSCGRIPGLIDAVRGLHFEPFSLQLDQIAEWPNQHIAWAGCRQKPPALLALVSALHDLLAANGFRFDRQHESFTPHFTLIRKLERSGLAQAITPPISWQCEQFVLMASRLEASGSAYQQLASFSAGRHAD